MTKSTQPLFDPFAPSDVQTEDAFSKGMITGDNAEALKFASGFVDLNIDFLSATFPGQAVSVVADDDAPDGVAFYPGDSVFDAENNARHFGCGRPYSTWNPFGGLTGVVDDRLALARDLRTIGEITAHADPDDEIAMLYQDVPPKDGGNGLSDEEFEELMKKVDELNDKVANETEDGKFAEIFGPRFTAGDQAITGGKIVSGAFKNFKTWLIDSGATTSSISQKNFDLLKKKGATPKVDGEEKVKTAAGKATFKKFSGITMQFARKGADGKPELVDCDVPLLVLSVDLLGVDQLKKTGTIFTLDAANGSVDLMARPAAKAPKKKTPGKK